MLHHWQLVICQNRWSWSKMLPNKNCKFPLFLRSPACLCWIEICFYICKFIYLHDCMNAWYHRIRLKIWHLANQKFCMFWLFAAEAATGVGFGITYPHRGSLASNFIYIVSYSTYCPSSSIVKSGLRTVNKSVESCLKSQGVRTSTLAFNHTDFAFQIQLKEF